MDIAIYYQKWNAKEKNSHTLLEQAVRRYARENALLLPETLVLASAEQKKKPRFQNAESIHFSISHSGDWWSCAISTEEVGLDIQQEQHCRAERLAQTFLSSTGSSMAGKKRIFAFLQTMGIQRKLCKIYRCRTDTGNGLFLCHKSVRYSDGSSGCLPAVGGFSARLPYGGHSGT